MLVAGRRGGMAERVARGQVKSTSWPSELLGPSKIVVERVARDQGKSWPSELLGAKRS